MANSNVTLPGCPRCKRPTRPLVREGDRQRFECTVCSETFWAPAIAESMVDIIEKPLPGFAFAPISIPERTATDSAGPRATCEKCGKPYFNLGKRYEDHVTSCDGKKKYREKVSRTRRSPLDLPTPTQVYAAHIAALMARRSSLEAEIRGIDSAVLELTAKMQGAEGPPQGPFVVGNTQTR